jgi:hypothetical protein
MADLSEIGKTTADLIDRLEQALPHGAEIGAVAIIAEVNLRVDEDGSPIEGDPNVTDIIFRCSDDRRWIQSGLFRRAMQRADQAGRETE